MKKFFVLGLFLFTSIASADCTDGGLHPIYDVPKILDYSECSDSELKVAKLGVTNYHKFLLKKHKKHYDSYLRLSKIEKPTSVQTSQLIAAYTQLHRVIKALAIYQSIFANIKAELNSR